MEKYLYQIRAHHGMCISYFEGKGYSNEFTAHMSQIVNELRGNPSIYVCDHTDILCAKCPHNKSGICATADLVAEYDRQVLAHCDLSPGAILPFEELREKIYENIIFKGIREKICGSCEWNSICQMETENNISN